MNIQEASLLATNSKKTVIRPSRLKVLLSSPLLLLSMTSLGQTVISGKVTDEKGKPIANASVYLDNTLDGGTADSSGAFKFTTTETGQQTIVASEISHENGGTPITVNGDVTGIELKLKKIDRQLSEVSITAGAFEASNENNTVLKPLDIVTTAGAQADVVRAIETLPGTQKAATQNGLMVRGGDVSEAAYIVDGVVIQNAFMSGPPGVSTRSRFGAFQYKGVSFSSGGYSARYGQALSAVLEMNTLDLPDKSTVNLGLNMAGVYASGSKLWKNSGGTVTAYYNNLQPFYGIAETNFDYYDVPKGGGGSANYVWKVNKDGLLKVGVNGSTFRSGIGIPAYDTTDPQRSIKFGLTNDYYGGNASYKQLFGSKFSLFTATAYSYNNDDIKIDATPAGQTDIRAQLRLEGKYYITTRLNILLGTELQHYDVTNKFGMLKADFDEQQIAGYTELEWQPVKWLAVKPGLRYERSELLQKDAIAPRGALAIKTSKNGQVSLASGVFYQNPDYAYLYQLSYINHDFNFQKAVHYIANYQWQTDERTLRIEGYYKDYSSLIKEYDTAYNGDQNRQVTTTRLDNSGYGYATGAELFWRDRKTVKNMDYWISYSYIDTRRLYKNLPTELTPTFISDHNLNLVGKYWIDKLQTQINMTYSYASGRPSYYTRQGTFLSERTPDYHNLSFTINYLTSVKKWFTVIYAGVDNVTNHKNVFGYRYSADGMSRSPVLPALYRSFFIGVNFSLTEFNKDEL